jgi:TRAP-type C4-dicarboxylate transport system permease small subunit
VKKIIDSLQIFTKYLSAFCIFFLSIFIIMDIFGRELLSSGLPWAQKLSVYLMIWAGFLGSAQTNIKGAHLRPEIADKLWPESKKSIFHRLRHLFTATFNFGAMCYAIEYVLESREFEDTSPILGDFPLWIIQAVIPISFFLMGLSSLIFSFSENIAPNGKREVH